MKILKLSTLSEAKRRLVVREIAPNYHYLALLVYYIKAWISGTYIVVTVYYQIIIDICSEMFICNTYLVKSRALIAVGFSNTSYSQFSNLVYQLCLR
jgi:hypothetical protein